MKMKLLICAHHCDCQIYLVIYLVPKMHQKEAYLLPTADLTPVNLPDAEAIPKHYQ